MLNSRVQYIIYLLTLIFCSIAFHGFADGDNETAYIPLVKFNQAAQSQKWVLNSWGGEKKATLSFEHDTDSEYPEFVRLNYVKSDATFNNFAFFQENKAKWQNKPVKGFYLRYRIKDLDGSSQYEYACDKYSFYNGLGLIRDGKWNILKMNPGGWCKNNQQFSFDAVNAVNLIFHGSGTVDIAELGIIFEYSLQKNKLSAPQTMVNALYKNDSGIKLDGRIDENIWSSGKIVRLTPANSQTADHGNNTQAFVTADAKGLYCAARCFKSDMAKLKAGYKSNSVTIYDDESIEFYIDIGRSAKKFRKVSVNANGFFGGITNSLDKSGIIAASSQFKDRWETEVFLPWDFLGETPDGPFIAGFNVTRNCYDDGRLERSGWTTSVWNAVNDFGVVNFGKIQARRQNNKDEFAVGRIGGGKYVIKMQSSPDMLYNVSVYSPDGGKTAFAGRLTNGDQLIPFSFPVHKSGMYHIVASGYDNAGAIVFVAEENVNEEAFSAFKPLDIDELSLFPLPKIFEKQTGDILLPAAMKAYVGEGLESCKIRLDSELKNFYNVELAACTQIDEAQIAVGLAGEPAIKKLIRQLSLENDFSRIKYDGFAILATSGKILIAANEKRGVLYGVNAFLDMVKMTSGDIGPAKVCSAKVVDWPQTENRFFCQSMHSFYPSTKYDIAFYESMLKKFPMHFRYNGFLFELGDYYQWQTIKIGNHLSWNTQEYANLIDFINSNYMPVMPSIQSLGHMDWWLLRYDAAAALREDGGKQVMCTRNPDSYKTLFGFYDEAWKMCSRNPEFKPRYFYTSLDEVRWQTFSTPDEKRCKYCQGIPKNRIYLEHIKKLDSYIREHEARMLMFTDMLTEDHNGLNEFKCAEILNDITRDVIMCHWSHLDHPSIAKFNKMGFENWKILTAYQEDRIHENMVKGYGFGVYTYHWWLSRTRCEENGGYGLMAQALFLNNCWNGLPGDGSEVWRKYTRIYGTQIMRNWSRKPLIYADRKISPVDLTGVVNKTAAGAGGWFSQGLEYDLAGMDFNVDKIAGIPVKFARINDQIGCLLLNSAASRNATIKLDRKAASFILLHAAHLDKKDCISFWDRKNYIDPLEGKKIVKYTVNYADGATVEFSINYGWNIGEWLIDPGLKRNIFAKYVADSRYIWEGKTAYAKSKNIDNDIAVYQYEWVNPFPEKAVDSLKLESVDKYISYALLAASLREIK